MAVALVAGCYAPKAGSRLAVETPATDCAAGCGVDVGHVDTSDAGGEAASDCGLQREPVSLDGLPPQCSPFPPEERCWLANAAEHEQAWVPQTQALNVRCLDTAACPQVLATWSPAGDVDDALRASILVSDAERVYLRRPGGRLSIWSNDSAAPLYAGYPLRSVVRVVDVPGATPDVLLMINALRRSPDDPPEGGAMAAMNADGSIRWLTRGPRWWGEHQAWAHGGLLHVATSRMDRIGCPGGFVSIRLDDGVPIRFSPSSLFGDAAFRDYGVSNGVVAWNEGRRGIALRQADLRDEDARLVSFEATPPRSNHTGQPGCIVPLRGGLWLARHEVYLRLFSEQHTVAQFALQSWGLGIDRGIVGAADLGWWVVRGGALSAFDANFEPAASPTHGRPVSVGPILLDGGRLLLEWDGALRVVEGGESVVEIDVGLTNCEADVLADRLYLACQDSGLSIWSWPFPIADVPNARPSPGCGGG